MRLLSNAPLGLHPCQPHSEQDHPRQVVGTLLLARALGSLGALWRRAGERAAAAKRLRVTERCEGALSR